MLRRKGLSAVRHRRWTYHVRPLQWLRQRDGAHREAPSTVGLLIHHEAACSAARLRRHALSPLVGFNLSLRRHIPPGVKLNRHVESVFWLFRQRRTLHRRG